MVWYINKEAVLRRLAEQNTTLTQLADQAELHPSHAYRLVRGVHPAAARTRRRLMTAPALAGLSFHDLFCEARAEEGTQ